MLTKKELKIRRQFIGGSDVPSILNLEYGCALNLWYDKRGMPEDYPILNNHHMERGNALEPVVINLLKKKFKYKIDKVMPKVSPIYPFMRGSIDGLIIAKGKEYLKEPVVLEIKCPSMNNFLKIKKEGISQSWIVQAQHYCAVWDVKMVLFAIFNTELWELLTFEVNRDDELINGLIEKEEAFWKMVTEGPAPEPLPEGDKRCKKCTRRKTCGRDEIIEEANFSEDELDVSNNAEFKEAIEEYLNAKEVKEEAELIIESSKERLDKILGNNKKMRGFGHQVWRQQNIYLDTKTLFAEHPEIDKNKYTKLGKIFINIR